MDQYTSACYEASKLITNRYSTSFGLSIRLFAPELRKHIYAMYGLVRIADEIVDTYKGSDQKTLLDDLESETLRALKTGYSTNPLVHAFAVTAGKYTITPQLITPFFESMRSDITPQLFNQSAYETYIYGSAEVVGLMCLKVFTNDAALYNSLEPGAKRLGAAYQKVNFLRDIAADANTLDRWYFPEGSYKTFDEKAKTTIIKDIESDFTAAKPAIDALPHSSRKAVLLSYHYYSELLKQLKLTSARELKRKRIRVSDARKAALFIRTSSGFKNA